MKKNLLLLLTLFALKSSAQKKPLDHTVYDSWKSPGEKMISNNGQYIVYTVNPQEGDGELVIQNPISKYKKIIARGYNAVITEDSRFLICKIKAVFQDTRQAKIKKKKGDDLPKDSMAIIALGVDSVWKSARIKNFKTPEKAFGFVAFQKEKALPDSSKKLTDSLKIKNNLLAKFADSVIRKSIDSIKGKITKEELSVIINNAAGQILQEGKDIAADAEGDESAAGNATEGTDLILKNLTNNKETIFKLVTEYLFDKQGTRLLIETSKNSKDSNSKAFVLLYDLKDNSTDTIMKTFNDAKSFAFDEAGKQLSFVAERDSNEKSLVKFYKLWYYKTGQDSATIIADKASIGMQLGFSISENAKIEFSKDGKKIFFGNAPIRSPKDTTLVDFEIAKLDVWNYKDDYLQPQQLKNLDKELKRSYTAVYHTDKNVMMQLGNATAENITMVNEGNADWVLGESNKGNRVEAQWTGRTRSNAYVINCITGIRKPVFKNLYANAAASPAGNFVFWYDEEKKNYFTYELATGITRNVSSKIKLPLYDEENDVPDLPNNYGVMGWQQGDSALYVYDQFDAWKVSPVDVFNPSIISLNYNSTVAGKLEAGRIKNQITRYVSTDKEDRFFTAEKNYLFTLFNRISKESGISFRNINSPFDETQINYNGKAVTARHTLSKNGLSFIFSKENYLESPNFFYADLSKEKRFPVFNKFGDITSKIYPELEQLSNINPQQNEYNWGTAELYTWKTYTGKTSTGIVYKPEGFDPKKKYPMICYFYEKLSNGVYSYQPPSPTPSRLNISFFVSRGYIVFAPDIYYTTGHPGNDAYNHIVSGARALVKAGFVDSTKIGIQGQSWGGYQVAYLITKTKLFKAAWAGAPVANMTSAYGGIRWESGLNRQFQYEKQQSRIGASLWDKPQLYIENSPLFHLPKVQTPLAIMHNDADGAVPWYQGIELFTGLKRLGKPVWMLNYNGEAHNLVERRNRKDIQIREQQFFDWLLKGEKPAKWITEGVPAIDKGKDWGLDTE